VFALIPRSKIMEEEEEDDNSKKARGVLVEFSNLMLDVLP
jgi:hypothetical protein